MVCTANHQRGIFGTTSRWGPRRATVKQRVAFAGTHPGKIIAVDMSTHGGELICQKDAFLCAAFGTSIDIAFRRKLGVGFFGGEGFILQRLKGDGMAFIHIGGTVIKRELRPDEVLRVDTGCLAAMTADVDYNIERSGNLKTMLFGGEGVFLATLRGPGTVYVQSMPFSRLVNRILRTVGPRTSKSNGSNNDSNNDSSFDDAGDDD